MNCSWILDSLSDFFLKWFGDNRATNELNVPLENAPSGKLSKSVTK